MPDGARYDDDFFLWSQDQAERLRRAAVAGSNVALDWENLAEEIESLGKRDRRELHSRLETILTHLIKLRASPAVQPRQGWKATIARERRKVKRILNDSPTLRNAFDIDEIDNEARHQAAADLLDFGEDAEAALIRLGVFPELVERMLEEDFFPHPPEPPLTSGSA